MSNNNFYNLINNFDKSDIKDLSKSATIYTRCSTAKQNQNSNQSLQTQVAICIEYAHTNNMTITNIISEVIPGHNSKKQSYNSVLKNYNTHFIIADASRLSRNISDSNIFVSQCEKQNILIHSVRDNIITNSHQERKKFFNCIYDGFIESSIIGKRVSSALNIRRRLGSYFGKPPYGFKIYKHIDIKTGIVLRKLTEDPYEQNIIEFITKLYYGCSMTDLYKTFRAIKPYVEFKLLDSKNNEFDSVKYGNIIKKDIKILLEENDITYRGDSWKTINIFRIINNSNSRHKIINNSKNKIINNNKH